MTVLGEAFIEVRGDLKPYIRDLDRELKAATERFEKNLSKSFRDGLKGGVDGLGDDTGDKLGDGISRKVKSKLGQKGKPPWVFLTSALASALDDGISALPAELKAALVIGIAAALPFVGGALTGLISAAVGVGFAGLGSVLAFQFESVAERGSKLLDSLRLIFVRAASSFEPVMLDAMDTIEDRFERLSPLLSKIFGTSSGFIGPLTEGLLDFVEKVLEAIGSSIDNIGEFVDELGAGLRTLGVAVGQFFKILADTGESGEIALRDLIFATASLIINVAKLLAFFTELYAILRNNPITSVLLGLVAFTQASDDAAGAASILGTRNRELGDSATGVIKLTDEETKALKAMDKALKDAADAAFDLVQSQVDLERSLDTIREKLRENGRTLDITNEKGRENVEAFLKGLKDAEEATAAQVASGAINSSQAAAYYDVQIEKVKALALNAGITNQQFDTMFGNIINVAQLRLDAEAMGLVATTQELQAGSAEARELFERLKRIRDFRLPKQGTRGFSEFAEGGIVSMPTHALIGEAGPEAVIPLTRPARAAELMRMSGLDKMLTPATPTVNVFVGNEQLDARTYRIVTENNNALSSSLGFGARGL